MRKKHAIVFLAVLIAGWIIGCEENKADNKEADALGPCLVAGDRICGKTSEGLHAILVCGVFDPQSPEKKEWIIDRICSSEECCFQVACKDVTEAMQLNAANCQLLGAGQSCSRDDQCASGLYCDKDIDLCMQKKNEGETCERDIECMSDLCIDKVCSPAQCEKDEDCSPPDECHFATCMTDGRCAYNAQPNGMSCIDDGNPCTTDSCSNGLCSHKAIDNGSACTDEGDPCTTDECQDGVCIHDSITACCKPNGITKCDASYKREYVCANNKWSFVKDCGSVGCDGDTCADSQCSDGEVECTSSTTYHKCNDNKWGTEKTCNYPTDTCKNGVCICGAYAVFCYDKYAKYCSAGETLDQTAGASHFLFSCCCLECPSCGTNSVYCVENEINRTAQCCCETQECTQKKFTCNNSCFYSTGEPSCAP